MTNRVENTDLPLLVFGIALIAFALAISGSAAFKIVLTAHPSAAIAAGLTITKEKTVTITSVVFGLAVLAGIALFALLS